MFGMLDYRAYKLLWLLRLPWRVVAGIAFFLARTPLYGRVTLPA
jgi:hypothetical protein